MAAYIADNTDNEAYYVNNSFLEDYERHKNGKLIYADVNEFNFDKFDGAVFVTPANRLFPLLAKIKGHKKSKICLYVYDERSVKWMFSHFGGRAEAAELRELLKSSDACSFVDAENYKKLKGFKKTILPQITDFSESEFKTKRIISDSVINVAYYGTLTPRRAKCFTDLLTNLKRAKPNKFVNFHIVGSSEFFYKIDVTSAPEANCRFIVTGKLTDEKSCEYIRENADIVFANDENALRAALFGVPVAIPVERTGEESVDKYVLFGDVKGYTLGIDEDTIAATDVKNYTLKNLLNLVYGGGKEELAETCYNRCVKKYSPKSVCENFLRYVSNSSLTPEKCLEVKVVADTLHRYENFFRKNQTNDFNAFIKYENTGRLPKKDGRKSVRTALSAAKKRISEDLDKKKKYRIYTAVQNGYEKKKRRIILKAQASGKLKVAFVVLFDSVFPTRTIFEKMLERKEFDPYIIVVPNVYNSFKYQLDLYDKGMKSLTEQYGDRVIGAYDKENDEYKEFGDEFGVMFFCNPYKHLVHPFHHVEYFLDKDVLPVYSSYGFAALKFWDEVIATPFYHYMWKCTLETESNLEHLKQTEIIKGRNGVVTGYLKMDKLAETVPHKHDRKRIMICPHHTVWGWKNLNIGNFLTYAEYFQKLPKMFPEVDFIFRPHPLLLPNLKAHKVWTQERIDEYMEKLQSNANLIYDTSGDYMQVFADSDAMIHDCGSFIGEYLYTMKPCCYMLKSEEAVNTTLVPLGQQCMAQHYHAFCEDDITKFIRDVVIGGTDPMKERREAFAKNELMVNYPHAAEAFIDILKEELKLK